MCIRDRVNPIDRYFFHRLSLYSKYTSISISISIHVYKTQYPSFSPFVTTNRWVTVFLFNCCLWLFVCIFSVFVNYVLTLHIPRASYTLVIRTLGWNKCFLYRKNKRWVSSVFTNFFSIIWVMKIKWSTVDWHTRNLLVLLLCVYHIHPLTYSSRLYHMSYLLRSWLQPLNNFHRYS